MFKHVIDMYTYIEQDQLDRYFYIITTDGYEILHESNPYYTFEEALADYNSNHEVL